MYIESGHRKKNNQYQMAILPWGATEPHNLHLPYLTDCILSHSIAVDAAVQLAADKGVNCMVLPPVAMGAQNPGQRDVAFCIHYRYETQKAILQDIVEALQHQGNQETPHREWSWRKHLQEHDS